MIWFWEHRDVLECSLNLFYAAVGISRQALHQMLDRRMREYGRAACILEVVRQIRRDHPTMSCRAMYHKVNPDGMGRDAFERLCSDSGFASQRPKNRCRTTNSSGVVRFDNLLDGMELTGTDQAWSSDITYFEVGERYCYITFIIDCHSRRILGHMASTRLTTEETTLPALRRAIAVRRGKPPAGIIFHSDGGGQYYDKDFLTLTKKYGFRNSMCEYAYENGKAERVNGTIKNNYLVHMGIRTFAELEAGVDRAVTLYNHERPHKALCYRSPAAFEKTT
jgi:transposase InsO family protein